MSTKTRTPIVHVVIAIMIIVGAVALFGDRFYNTEYRPSLNDKKSDRIIILRAWADVTPPWPVHVYYAPHGAFDNGVSKFDRADGWRRVFHLPPGTETRIQAVHLTLPGTGKVFVSISQDGHVKCSKGAHYAGGSTCTYTVT